MLKSGEILLLRLIRANNGKLNFCTLDRAAWRNGWRDLDKRQVFDATYSLIDMGYVIAEGENPGMPNYWITDSGMKILQEFIGNKS